MATEISGWAKQEAPVESFGLVSKLARGTVAATEYERSPYLSAYRLKPWAEPCNRFAVNPTGWAETFVLLWSS
jgi:hypothetical protein